MIDQIKTRLKNRKIKIMGIESMSKYAVLIPLIEKNAGATSILFEIRSKKLRRQPGEISFPGGKIESTDLQYQDAAIRETVEELGIDKEKIQILAELDTYVPSGRTIIYPFVATIQSPFTLSLNQDEVESVFTIPLDFFLKNKPEIYYLNVQIQPEENFPFHHIPKGKNYPWRKGKIPELFYYYEDKVIWGMTAFILYHFIQTIQY
ncbi:NUDIX hydrolase [Tepidibacillus sp. LV47]|uniref:NUDIX hydrolase n=1 Tax=Tepidibacillus sp. LV47 TaxID=3398228 RepID=UPI003AAB7997